MATESSIFLKAINKCEDFETTKRFSLVAISGYNKMEDDSRNCGICFEKIVSLGKIDSCQHMFHYKCIYRWSKISSNCPTCRVSFNEICHMKGNKLQKKIKIHEDSHSTEEDFSNSDIEEWQAICPVCQSSSPDFLLICEGEYGCSNVCHVYCLNSDTIQNHWVCPECQDQESESLAEEGSSSEEECSESCSELDSDPDAEYEPVDEEAVRRSTRRRNVSRRMMLSSDEFEEDGSSSEETIENSDSSDEANDESSFQSSNQSSDESADDASSEKEPMRGRRPLRRLKKDPLGQLRENSTRETAGATLKLPVKRERQENNGGIRLKAFVETLVQIETRKELEKYRDERINKDRINRTLAGMILRNSRLQNSDDPRTVQKMKTIIKNYIAGLI